MKKALLFLIAISVSILMGCTTVQKTEPVVIEKNPRIIERDLTQSQDVKKIVGKVSKINPENVITKIVYKEVPGECRSTNISQSNSLLIPAKNEQKSKTIQYDVINFDNESIVLKEHDKLDAIINKINIDDDVFLIGHSHGWSRYGTNRLATERANIVFTHLTQKGIEPERIHKLASWSKTSSSDSPSRGVQVYVINKNSKQDDAQLFLALL